MTELRGTDTAQCGYGLLGICCDSCLSGPCRLSPFDEEAGGAPCGVDRDWIVANNLLERVLLESLHRIAACKAETAGSGKAFAALFSPAGAFPTLHSLGMPRGTWMDALLEAAAGRRDRKQEPEALLREALRLSAFALAAEELPAPDNGPGPAARDLALPEAPSPLVVITADETEGADPERERLGEEIERGCAAAVPTYHVPIRGLAGFARAAYATWDTPLAFTGSAAVVVSPSAIPGLGALALGFSLLAIPGYPIRGSARVEEYLTARMKETFGHGMLRVPPREDIGAILLRSLRP